MIYLELYDSSKTYITPAGAIYDRARVQQDFPAAMRVPYVAETDQSGTMVYRMEPLAAMRSRYGVEASLSDQEAVAAIVTAITAEQEAQAEAARNYVSAEERTAAALEFLALNSLPEEV